MWQTKAIVLTTSKIRDNVEEKVDHRNYRTENNLPRTQKEENFLGNGGRGSHRR